MICDEAHRLVGHAEGLFATVLDAKKIKTRKRLFMTATPRYFKEHVKRRAAELEFELVSMDDMHVFGPEFHVPTFHEAISAKPEPLLTDYQVVVIGVSDRDAKAWAEQAMLVRRSHLCSGSGTGIARFQQPFPGRPHGDSGWGDFLSGGGIGARDRQQQGWQLAINGTS